MTQLSRLDDKIPELVESFKQVLKAHGYSAEVNVINNNEIDFSAAPAALQRHFSALSSLLSNSARIRREHA